MQLAHYSRKRLTRLYSTYGQTNDFKPCGLWFSVEGNDDGWREWCHSNDYAWEAYIVKTDLRLIEPEAVLILSTPEQLHAFTDTYGEDLGRRSGGKPLGLGGMFIQWDQVAARYKGIIIAPYIYACRLTLLWYYTWDCASGCVWDVSCLELT